MARETMTSTRIDLGTPYLRFERRGPIGWCRVDRPKARNAVDPAMYRGLGQALHTVVADREMRALVLTGTGDVFIPGGDMAGDDERPPHEKVPTKIVPFAAFRHSPVPVISAINGICQASGVTFTLLSDVSVASERARFRVPELLRGFPDTWLAALLPAHVGVGRARDLMITGRWIDAHEAFAMGLVTRLVEHDRLEEAAESAAYEALESAPEARKLWKRTVNDRYGVVDEMAFDAAPDSPEAEEGFRSFFEKRPPSWSANGGRS